MNKEVHYEGWLIKSPPTKRIWRARWRRRWFTLKQGEIPEQFCLEYYTDRNCRKLKGVIDLDQCEQVDCGLRLENRKQKFQFMFDIKTPKRTYYLAADTEADMRDWVNCICQVCHLHDTKQSNDMLQQVAALDENRAMATISTTSTSSNASNNTTTTTINSSAGGAASTGTSGYLMNRSFQNGGGGVGDGIKAFRHSNSNASFGQAASELLRRPNMQQPVIDQQPMPQQQYNNSDCAYVNTDYNNRETLVCEAKLEQQQQHQPTITYKPTGAPPASPSGNSTAALYLNSSMFQAQAQPTFESNQQARLAINANGVVRKIPENLVLNNTPLNDAQSNNSSTQHSVQPSPALSTASGPYIPISECFSGSPKFMLDGNNPTTPLNNLDPKFYDTPRSHNNIGLNLTNDQSYSPKITNCSLQQLTSTGAKANQAHRSDSDSESVFTDDDEWANPLPLRENVDRSTRPSDSSVENESFVVTYSQRFSKLPDDAAGGNASAPLTANANGRETKAATAAKTPLSGTTAAVAVTAAGAGASSVATTAHERLNKLMKHKNILSLDFKDSEKLHRDLPPQLSDTENTSPAIGPRDATSVVEESYDIPRSHNLPYYNMCQLYDDKMLTTTSPGAHNPIAASTPNLIAAATASGAVGNQHELQHQHSAESASCIKTLPRAHCYTNAAPSTKSSVEGNVFRYDFIEQGDLPPVNRQLKPKVSMEDKPPEECPAKPPAAAASVDALAQKMRVLNAPPQQQQPGDGSVLPPTVDRKLKPYLYKFATAAPASRRSTGAPLSMCIPNDGDTTNFLMETRTLPRQPRPNYATSPSHIMPATPTQLNSLLQQQQQQHGSTIQHQHQRTVSATAALPPSATNAVTQSQIQMFQMQAAAVAAAAAAAKKTNEHKLQYFELDIANAPSINRQSLSSAGGGAGIGLGGGGLGGAAGSAAGSNVAANRFVLPNDHRAPNKSTVVYNSVDFVKTEAFKRVREESKKKRECVNGNAINNNNSNSNNNNGNGNATTNAHNNNK